MAGSRERAFRTIYALMWGSLLLTIPTWIYGTITLIDLRAFNNMVIETGLSQRFHLFGIVALVLPIAALIIALSTRILINIQRARFNLYQVKASPIQSNNILIAYCVSLCVVIIVYLFWA